MATQPAPTGAPVLKTFGGLPIITPDSIDYLKILVYGSSGAGKTYFSATAEDDPRSGPCLMIDCEGGTTSVRKNHPKLPIVRVTSWLQFNGLYEGLRAPDCPFKTVIIDSVTEIQKLNMQGIMTNAVMSAPSKDPDRPLIDDWQKSIEQMRKLLRYYRDLPRHVIVTCLPLETRDEHDGTVAILPSLPGKLSAEIGAMFDIVLYLAAGTKKIDGKDVTYRQALCQPTPKFLAKDRSGNLGPVLEEPTMPKILDLVFGPVK